jgi:uncharacterized protein YegL
MKRVFIYVVSLYSYVASAQMVQGDLQLGSLITKLHDVINLQKDIEIQEIKGVYKLTPWHFAPNLNYDFINDNYYVTISTGPIISNMIGKRQEKRRLSAIERRYTNLERTSELKLKSLFLQVNQRITNLSLSYEILLNDIEIYKIKLQEHENHEIDTEAFLKERSAILNKIKNHNTDITDIQRSLFDIEQLTEQEFEIDLFRFYVSPLIISTFRGDKGGLQ